MASISFPDEFLWGVGTSAYQIEGAWAVDGKGPSVWDTFCNNPGRILDGSTGRIAADHYHQWATDIDLVRDLGCGSYRFSISWPRIFPHGRGTVNQAGLDFYDRIVDRLCEYGIKPMVTLYHWDLPQALQDEGGWAKRSILGPFADYVKTVVQRIGDRVSSWITVNEILSVAGAGYLGGVHAPGKKSPIAAAHTVHNMLLAHGTAAQILKANYPQAKVGIANAFVPAYPHRRKDAAVAKRVNNAFNRLCMDPILRGHYPAGVKHLIRLLNRSIRPGDFDIITTPIDFIGVNHYSRLIARRTAIPFIGFRIIRPTYTDAIFTDIDWEVYPEAFYDVLTWIRDEYDNPPILVTENGAAYADEHHASLVEDSDRITYIRSYISAMHRAIQEGVNVRGYFVWTLLDNFEWAFGYTKRFGLYYVDYETQQRVPKQSAHWYSRVCRSNSLPDT
ncbi:MAG: GH1 family beta-glucosidase [Spirochaeta sp.]